MYKPIAGEKPLWDFPDGCLAHREVAAYLVSEVPVLRRMVVFDVLVNNADRKGDHVLAMAGGPRYGVDHGRTFHSEHKLRTVLWGWIGEALSAEELEGVDRVSEGLEGELGSQLAKLLTAEEIASFAARCARLRSAGRFPAALGWAV